MSRIAIHKQVYGQGQPLVMLHGWAMHSGVWQAFAEQLAEHYQVICLDLPGHGHSQSVMPYRLQEIGQALLAAIDAPRFALLGWSLGATVALDMASRFPERIESLLLLAGNPKFTQGQDWPGVRAQTLLDFAEQLQNDTRQTLIRFLALQVNGLADGKAILKVLKEAVMAAPAPGEAVLQGGLKLLLESDLRPQLANISCPVTVLQGDIDTLVPAEVAAALQKLNPAIRAVLLPRAGHVPFLSHRQVLVEQIRQYL